MKNHPERKPIDFNNILIPCPYCGFLWKLERGKTKTECPNCHRKFKGSLKSKYKIDLGK